jgi:hypothetical protein
MITIMLILTIYGVLGGIWCLGLAISFEPDSWLELYQYVGVNSMAQAWVLTLSFGPIVWSIFLIHYLCKVLKSNILAFWNWLGTIGGF